MLKLKKNIDIFCDGACSGNPGPGGWGAYIIVKDNWTDEEKINTFEFELFGGIPNATNNIMEMTALIKAAEWLVLNGFHNKEVHFHLDSAYIVNCYEKKWWKKWLDNGWVNSSNRRVANIELWEKIIPLFQQPNFFFHKVAGHSGVTGNERADFLAKEGLKRYE